jgi:SAM-dependent methyltransferase
MDQKTEILDIAGFYDRLSGDYDVMTGFDQRFVRERPFIKLLVDRHRIGRAVDAGSGTGFHAILLARLGVSVTAVDLSPAMIAALRAHAADEQLRIAAVVGSFDQLPAVVNGPQDAVLSMGNTLAHMPDAAALESALTAFRQVLRPGGILLLQLLNYKRILAAREKVLADKTGNGLRFIRWYEYEGSRIRFNITVERTDGNAPAETRSVELTPFTDDDLHRAAQHAGFGESHTHGSIAFEPYDEERSRDTVFLAHVPQD